MRASRRQRWILAVVVLLAGAALYAAASHYDLRARMDRVVEWVRDAGPVPFFTAMTFLPAVGFPLSAFTVIAGPVFGPTLGVGAVVLLTILTISINVALSYWLAARALRPVAEWLVRRLGYRLPEVPRHAAWMTILVVRIVPSPFCIQSILLGLARVPFGPYLLVSITVPSAYATAVIVMGDALMRGDRWALLAAAALFAIVGTILHVMRKRLRGSAAALRAASDPE
jgi:uncharacterized membrane protein YdjX (TVP38/TMEM64 family)